MIFYVLCILIIMTVFFIKERKKVYRERAMINADREDESEDRKWLREYLFEYDKYKSIRLYSDRENDLWEVRMKKKSLRDYQQLILQELEKIPLTDWDDYVLHAIHTKSPALNYYLIDGKLDVQYMKREEMRGHMDALQAVKSVPISCVSSLREYFHLIHEHILNSVTSDNIFYLRGHWKVAQALRVFVASQETFIPPITKLYSRDLVVQKKQDERYYQCDVVGRLAYYFSWLRRKREELHFPIEGSDPTLEFNLPEIADAGNFEYEGACLTNLYLDLVDRLKILTGDNEPEHHSRVSEFASAHFVTFTYGRGRVRLVMHLGAVDYYPNRIFVIFFDVKPDDPIINNLRTYNLHLSANT